MSRTTDAHTRLHLAQVRATGDDCLVTIGTQEDVPAVIGGNEMQDMIADGGLAQSGTQMISVIAADLTDYADEPNGEPPKFTETIVRGVTAQILDVTKRDGIFYILTGDPSGSE